MSSKFETCTSQEMQDGENYHEFYNLFLFINLILLIFINEHEIAFHVRSCFIFAPFFGVFTLISVFQKGVKTLNKGVKTVDSKIEILFFLFKNFKIWPILHLIG